jgi:hypothetical protein
MSIFLEKLPLDLRVHQLPNILKPIYFSSSYFPDAQLVVNVLNLSFRSLCVLVLIFSLDVEVSLQVVNRFPVSERHRLLHCVCC